MMTKEIIHKEYIAMIYMYAPNNRAAKYVKPKLTDREKKIPRHIHNILGHFHISLSILME